MAKRNGRGGRGSQHPIMVRCAREAQKRPTHLEAPSESDGNKVTRKKSRIEVSKFLIDNDISPEAVIVHQLHLS